MSTIKEQIEWQKAWHREVEAERKETLRKIMRLAEKLCPIPYEQFVYQVAYELGVNYSVTIRKGASMKEVDILIGIGKLCKSQDGKLTLHK